MNPFLAFILPDLAMVLDLAVLEARTMTFKSRRSSWIS